MTHVYCVENSVFGRFVWKGLSTYAKQAGKKTVNLVSKKCIFLKEFSNFAQNLMSEEWGGHDSMAISFAP